MSEDTRFKPGHDERRKGAGRPPGAKNKMTPKLDEALKKADSSSKSAVAFLKEVMEGGVKGASVSNRITAAVKILDLSFKFEEKLEEALNGDRPSPDKKEEKITPLISLTSDQNTTAH